MDEEKPIEWCTQQLDTFAAVLPVNRRDMLADILTDEDVETLRHLVNECMGENTLRALTSDLTYLEAWSMAATGSPPLPRARSIVAQIRGPSSLAAAATRNRTQSWHADRRERRIAPARFSAHIRPACTLHRASPPGQLVNTHPLARS